MALVKAVGAAKVILMARAYGIGDDLDAYLLAFLFPSFAGDVVASASSPALIPLYLETKERQGVRHADRLLAGFLSATSAGCIVLTILIALFAGPLVRMIGSGFAPEKLELSRQLLLVMAPIVLLGGLGAVWRAALNAVGEFAVPSAIFAITPATIVAFVLAPGLPKDGWLLAYGTLTGAALESMAAALCVRRKGISPIPRWHGLDPRLLRAASQYWPVFLASVVFGASAYVHQSIAAALGPGSVSALNYGARMPAFMLALGPTALGTAVLPQFAAMASGGHWDPLRGALVRAVRMVAWVATPVTAAAILFSEPLVRLAFERGLFTSFDTEVVTRVQQFYLLQIPLALPAALLARLFSSMQSAGVLLAAAAVSLAANAAFGLLLVGPMGVAGLALAASLAALCHLGCLGWMLSRNSPWAK